MALYALAIYSVFAISFISNGLSGGSVGLALLTSMNQVLLHEPIRWEIRLIHVDGLSFWRKDQDVH